MSIAAVQSGQSVYSTPYVRQDSKQAESAGTYTQGEDKVTISQEAMRRAQEAADKSSEKSKVTEQTQAASTAKEAEEEYPLEAYRAPDWYVDLFGGNTMVTAELGISWEEGQTGYQKMNAKDQRLFDEYSEIVDSYWKQGLDDAGISGTSKYWHNFLENPTTQEQVHQSVYQQLADNPRAMELMKYFNIDVGI
ncbi:MAG: hypothetical protein ACNI3A_11535 [Desulfovibrio sp.]|uniref:hypothetical protein n=1 Tax=Desulfovibrio sp. 7SRBS1 TaxID=3378064 RepID=UPI003B40D31B